MQLLNEQLRWRVRAFRECALQRLHDLSTFLRLRDSAMNGIPDAEEVPESHASESPATPWARVVLGDLEGLDFESPITGASTAECEELSDLFRAAIQPADGSAEVSETPDARVFTTLHALSGMHFKPDERNEPFGPMFTFNGNRSAIPSDFRACIDVLAAMADRAASPVLLARLADVCWLLDRKKGKLAAAAISAYVEIVQKTKSGELKFRFAPENGALEPPARDYLRRALCIGRAIGWDKPETMAARELVVELRKHAIEKQTLQSIGRLCDLDLDFGVSDPGEIGADLDRVLAASPADLGSGLITSS